MRKLSCDDIRNPSLIHAGLDSGNLIVEASLQIPVRQELNGTQLGTDFAFKGGIRWLIF